MVSWQHTACQRRTILDTLIQWMLQRRPTFCILSGIWPQSHLKLKNVLYNEPKGIHPSIGTAVDNIVTAIDCSIMDVMKITFVVFWGLVMPAGGHQLTTNSYIPSAKWRRHKDIHYNFDIFFILGHLARKRVYVISSM
jgi:hypothetical protein